MVEIFSKSQFEQALPIHNKTNQPLWSPLGFKDGEYVYQVNTNNPHVKIQVRSSVKANGISAATGQDSIRCWLTDEHNQPLGSKISRWTTRTKGWNDRLIIIIRQLYKLANKINNCQKCNSVEKIFKVNKTGPNKGRFFKKCNCDNTFTWVTNANGEFCE